MHYTPTSALTLAADPSITDESIVGRVLGGEKQAYEVIMRRYNERLYKIARTYVKDEDAIEDILQETYVKAYENLGKFEGRSQLSTWLTRILINEALASINKTSKLDAFSDQIVSPDIKKVQSAEHQVIRKNMQEIIEKAIDGLPQKYSSVFVMRELEGMNIREVAHALDISEENVKVRLFRAKKALQEVLRKSMDGMNLYSFGGQRCNRITEQVMNRIGT